jgi:hypothetical protein
MKCFASMIGCTLLGLFTGIGVIDAAAAHGIGPAWCYVLGVVGGGMSGLPACLD